MADSAHLTEQFSDAWTTKDFVRGRSSKTTFTSRGRSTRSTTLTPTLNSLRGLTRVMTGLEKLKVRRR